MADAEFSDRARIVSVHMLPESKRQLDQVCDHRGMTIKTLLGRLIMWFVELDKTEQSIVLGQVELSDFPTLITHISRRRGLGGDAVAAAPVAAHRSPAVADSPPDGAK
jgi:hypothetical protein